MNLLGKNVSANFLSSIWQAIVPLIAIPLYVNILGIEGYGLIGFYTIVVMVFSIIDTGISSAVGREIAWLSARPLEKYKISNLLWTAELIFWLTLLILTVIFLFGVYLYSDQWFKSQVLSQEQIRQAMLLMGISLLVQVPSGLYVSGLMALQRQVECSVLLGVFTTIRTLGAIIVLLGIFPDIRLFFFWQLLVSIFQTVKLRHLLWSKISNNIEKKKFSIATIQSISSYGGNAILITGLSISITQIDKFILGRILSLEMFGYYMLATTISISLSRISTPLIQAFSPRFTEFFSLGDSFYLEKTFRFLNQLMYVVIIPPTIICAVFAVPLITVWMGNSEIAENCAPILFPLVVGAAFTCFSYPALSILYSKNKLRPVIITSFAFIFIFPPLMLLAILKWGAVGAAAIGFIYGLISFLVYQFLALKQLGILISSSTNFMDFAIPCVTSIISCVIFFLLWPSGMGRFESIFLLGVFLVLTWILTILSCPVFLRLAKKNLQ